MPKLTGLISVAFTTLLCACGSAQTSTSQTTPELEPADTAPAEPEAEPADLNALIPNARRVSDDLLVGGQPTVVQIVSLADEGYQTVISLRAPGEPGSEGEQEAVEAAGMRFVSIPVDGAAGLTVVNAERLSSELQSGNGPTVLHCGSGNRAGAMIALVEMIQNGASPEVALERGRAAGLTRLEESTEAILRELCQDLPDGDCGE